MIALLFYFFSKIRIRTLSISKLFLTHKISPAAAESGCVELGTNVMGHEMGLWVDLISDKTIHIIMKFSQPTHIHFKAGS